MIKFLDVTPEMEFNIFMTILAFLLIIAIFVVLGILIKHYSDTKKAANSWGYYNRFNREQRRIRDKRKGRY